MADSADAELIARMARGDEIALGALYDRYASGALALAIRVTGDRAEGEDVLQTVFLRLWQEAGRYDASRGTVATWVMTSVRHASIDRLRRRQAHERAAQQAAAAPAVIHEAMAGTDTSKRVRSAIEALPAEQREAIELAFFQGLSQSDIAARIGQPLGTVKTRVRLGMIKLRETLAGQVQKT